MRASFAEEKDRNIYSRYSNPNTNEFVEKYVRWKGQLLVLLFLEWLRYIQRWLLLNSGDHIVSSSSVLGRHILFINYFPNGIFKHRILIHNQKRSKVSSHQIQNSFAESPTNPAVDIIDLELLKIIAKSTI
jgi:O-succinylhomoserine sulfhydrylase